MTDLSSHRSRSLVRRDQLAITRLALLFVGVSVLLATGAGPAPLHAAGTAAGATDTAVGAAPSGAPMVIVPNVGQAPADVLFEARSLGRLVRFTRSAVHFDGGTSLEFVDAQVRTVRAEDQQQGVVHLLLGNDPMDWRTRIPTYSALVYEDAQPGVDVVFDTDERGLRATVRARNAAGSSRLAWRITRSSRLGQAVELAADLVAELATSLSQGAVAASGSPASAGLVSHGDGTVTFMPGLGAGESSITVALDVLFASYLGGGRDDSAADVVLDGSGNTIVVGTTQSRNFPTENPLQEEIASGSLPDAFVTKFDASGTSLLWSTYLGGNSVDHGTDVALDASGNVVIVGYTGSQNFPTQDPIQEDLAGGDSDAFVTVLTSDGSQLVFSTFLGGRAADHGYGVALGAHGGDSPGESIYVAGGTDSSDFPTENAFQSRWGGSSDAFVTALVPDRSGYLFSTYLGANSAETANGIDVDSSGAAHVTGYVDGPGFPLENPFQRNYRGDSDVFVTKFAPGGGRLIYSSYLGGRNNDTGYALKLDPAGRAVVVGQTESRDFPPVNAYQQALKGDSDVFISRVSQDGGTLEYSTFFGGTATESGKDLAVDSQGRMHLTGWTLSSNFPLENPVQDRIRGGGEAIVSTFSGDGQQLLFSTLYGGARQDQGSGLAAAADGSVLFVGYTESADFPTGDSSFQPDFAGQGDAFVVRLQTGAAPETPVPTTAVPTFTSSPTASPTPTTPGTPATDTPTATAETDTPTPETSTPSPTATGDLATATATATPTDGVGFSIFAPYVTK